MFAGEKHQQGPKRKYLLALNSEIVIYGTPYLVLQKITTLAMVLWEANGTPDIAFTF